MTKSLALVLSALVLGTTGCMLIGFDPIDPSGGESGESGASASGGVGGGSHATGGTGDSGHGGAGGVGGMSGGVGGAGTGGGEPDASVAPPDGGSMIEPDAGPPTQCTGMPNGSPCDDGAYCTVGDLCSAGECLPGLALPCDAACNTGVCDELLDRCVFTPVLDGALCGVLNTGMCIDGRCNAQIFTCPADTECQPLCESSMCTQDCRDARSCEPTCRDGADCTTDCTDADNCDFECSEDSICYFNCNLTDSCSGRCDGASRCAVLCTDSGHCGDFECVEESECKLQCAAGESCNFAKCWDDPQECGPGVVICGSDCSDW